jgi:integrase
VARLKLTDQAVRRLSVEMGQRVDYYDSTLPGFGLRVAGPSPRTPEGRKTWILFYRHGATQKRLAFGTYPAVALADARAKARTALQVLATGADPATAREAAVAERERRRPSVREVAERYLAEGMASRRRPAPRYVAETRRNLENHVLPRLGDRALELIQRADVKALVRAVADGEIAPTVARDKRKRGVRGGPVAANRVLAALGSMFSWAMREELVATNPCTLVQPPGEEVEGDRTLAQDELADLWRAFLAMGHPFGTFYRLALLTGQRRSEVAGMRWADVDLDERIWTLSARMVKSRRVHVVALSNEVVAIVRAAPRLSVVMYGADVPSPYVLTTTGATPISGFSRAKRDVDGLVAEFREDRGAEPMERWTTHDLRRACATGLGALGVRPEIISRVLNHRPEGITDRVYNLFEYLEDKRKGLQLWSSLVHRAAQPHPAGELESRSRSKLPRAPRSDSPTPSLSLRRAGD